MSAITTDDAFHGETKTSQPSPPSTTPTAVFFDCDDCLYQNNWQTAQLLTARIDQFCVSELNLPTGRAYELYKEYGTCLKGLTEEKIMPASEEAIDRFLEYCHDVPLTDITPDPELRAMILRIKLPRWIFTASVASHAKR